MSSASSPKGAKRRGGLYNLDIFGDRSHTYHAFSSRLKHERWNYRNKGRADYPLPQNFHIGFVKMPCTGNILIVDIELWTPGDCCRWDVAVYWAVNFSLSGVIFRPFVYDVDWSARRAQAPVQSSLIRRLNAEYWTYLALNVALRQLRRGHPRLERCWWIWCFFRAHAMLCGNLLVKRGSFDAVIIRSLVRQMAPVSNDVGL